MPYVPGTGRMGPAAACLLALCAGLLLFAGSASATGWRSSPTVPGLDAATRARVVKTLERGRRLGNRADVFAKLGDSISQSPAFLQGLGCAGWRPGRYRALRSTARYFSARALPGESGGCAAVNSFSRASAATLAFTPSGWALDPGGSQDPACEADETPLVCEVRIDRPGYAVVLFGTNDVTVAVRISHDDTLPEFTASMLGIVAALRDLGVVPILSTLPPRTDDPTAEAWTERFNAALYHLGEGSPGTGDRSVAGARGAA